MVENNIDRLIDLAKEKYELINKMQGLTEKQKVEIEKENMEELNRILDDKDKLIRKINRVDVDFLNIFSQIKKSEGIKDIDELDKEKYSNLKELKEIVTRISSTLMAIFLLDKKNQEKMKESIETTKQELKRIRHGQRAYKGYNKPIGGSILIDEKK